MKAIDIFALEKTQSDERSGEVASSVRFDGEPIDLTLKGERLEHQYQIDQRYLLITTASAPWTEALYFYLLDQKLRKIDELSMGGDFYDSAFLANLKVTSEREIEFSYFSDNDRWHLTVLPKKKFALPNLNPYSGISGPGWPKQLTTHFELKQKETE